MIETLSLRNFKVLREVDVRLRPLTLVVGPNGSGKTSLLAALDLGLKPWATKATWIFDPDSVKSQLLKDPFQLRLTGKDSEGVFSVQLTENTLVKDGSRTAIGRQISPPILLDLDTKKLATPSYMRDLTYALPSNGEGLSWILAGLQLELPERFASIVERLREVVPSVQSLRLKRTILESQDVGYELLFEMKGSTGIPASAVSEGTLTTLALLTVLTVSRPGLILIENLERGLHPRALGDLITQIRSLLSHHPDLQIVATSHSPYLLDFLKADEILLTSPDEDGYSSVKALSDHPDYDRWKDVMAPGEFWSTVGESWVVQKS